MGPGIGPRAIQLKRPLDAYLGAHDVARSGMDLSTRIYLVCPTGRRHDRMGKDAPQ